MTVDADLRARVEAWIAVDPDEDLRDELQALLADASAGGRAGVAAAADLKARFAGRLEFGTAGLRAPMGGGPMRMNRMVVRQAAAGLARYLGPGTTVVIGYDARHRSDEFALDSARVLAAAGCRVARFATTVPTPVLAFAVRHLGADAGVMCTASHNPRLDNGYKVYLGDGAQIIPPADADIAAAIDAIVTDAGPIGLAAEDDPAITVIGDDVIEAYVEHATGGARSDASGGAASPVIVYTPMHGVGRTVAHDVLARSGFAPVHDVSAQADPDPEFPTVAFPNPEEPGALDLAIAEARRRRADVVLANDPDADRLGVVVPVRSTDPFDDGSGWRILTGNEIGAVLAEHVLGATTGSDRLVVTTFVSSRLLARQAEHHGVHHAEVLTGFKWIVRPGMERADQRFVFGYEEALGFTVDPYVRDKDGITAARAFAQVVATSAAQGRTVGDLLEEIARRHGHHATRTWSARFDGPDAQAQMAAVVARWRTRPPTRLDRHDVIAVTDMARGGRLPPTDAIVVDLVGDARVVLRPSGTEPKIKVYLEVVEQVAPDPAGYASAVELGRRTVEALRVAVAASLGLAPA